MDDERLYLVRYGELALRGENRPEFVRALERNVRRRLDGTRVYSTHGRLYVQTTHERAAEVERVLASTFGIVAYAEARQVAKDIHQIAWAALQVAEASRARGRSFKIEARRLDKSFPFSSYQIACRLGDDIRAAFPELVVDVRNPDVVIRVEVREHAYVYGPQRPGLRGLPAGCSGRGLLLLSGGIDSPVAGYLMGFRGLHVDAVYFHTPPYTSPQAQEKVQRITERLRCYLPETRLAVVPFTEVQLRIREQAEDRAVTLLMRACMMRIADELARASGAHALITGESLGQVASQTPEGLRFTGSIPALPVFRPLIGMDKDQIIAVARRIGTYELSVLPYPDCCTLFAPRHPLIRPDFARITEAYRSMELEVEIRGAIEKSRFEEP